MKFTKGNIDLIDQFIRNEMSAEEANAFVSSLSSNPEMAKSLDWMKDLQHVVDQEGIDEIKAHLINVEASHSSNSNAENQRPLALVKVLKFVLPIAAAITLLIIAFPGILGIQTEDDLFEKYFNSYPNVIVDIQRSQGAESNDLTEAMVAYSKKDFEQSVQLFDQLLAQEPNDTLMFYKCISLLGLDNHANAQKVLIELNEKNSSAFADSRHWYEIITHLALNQSSEAKFKLKQYVDQSIPYNRTNAKKLLIELSN